jgi:hypothetical protein
LRIGVLVFWPPNPVYFAENSKYMGSRRTIKRFSFLQKSFLAGYFFYGWLTSRTFRAASFYLFAPFLSCLYIYSFVHFHFRKSYSFPSFFVRYFSFLPSVLITFISFSFHPLYFFLCFFILFFYSSDFCFFFMSCSILSFLSLTLALYLYLFTYLFCVILRSSAQVLSGDWLGDAMSSDIPKVWLVSTYVTFGCWPVVEHVSKWLLRSTVHYKRTLVCARLLYKAFDGWASWFQSAL